MTSIIRNHDLASAGQKKISWVEHYMPTLNNIGERLKKEQTFQDKTVVVSVHLEAKTAYLALVLHRAGAKVVVTGSNPLSTQDDVAAALVAEGLTVYATYNCTEEEYFAYLNAALDHKPHIIIDDGGAQDRKKPSTDHVDGLVLVDLVVYVPLSLLKTIPQKGLNMEIGDHIYQITKVHPEAGEIVLYLEMLTE